jgi:sensor histidine kinase YesM
MARYLQLGVLLLCVNICNAQQPVILNGQPNWQTGMDIEKYTLTYEDVSERPLSLNEVQQQSFLSFRETNYRYAKNPRIVQWLKFKISNTSKTDTIHLILNLNVHYILRLYQQNVLLVSKGISTEKKIADWTGLDFSIPPQTAYTYYASMEEHIRYLTPVFVRLETAGTYFQWWDTIHYEERWLRFVLPLMAGILLLISIFGLYQYYLLKDKAFLYYFFYALSAFLLSVYYIDTRSHLSFLSQGLWWFCDSFLFALIMIAYVYFVNGIMNISVNFPRTWMVLKCLLAIILLQAFISFGEHLADRFLFSAGVYYSDIMFIPAVLTPIILLITTIKSRNAVKRFIIAGLSSLILFFFLPSLGFSFSRFHNVSNEVASFVNYGPVFFMFGITLEAMFFASALAYRTKLIMDEKNNLQLKYTVQLEEELRIKTEALHQQNAVLEAQKIKQLQTEFDHRIAATEMTALRAQMNPHFIFNCLNSIKLYTLENDSATASEYLTKFSQLIRLVWENSRSEKVTLQKELETLKLYIDMEAMRFKDKVRYCINVDERIDAGYIEIPPLLIQPYVENAIWHGLMHKKEGGLIKIDVGMANEHLLHVEISDDGIGREKAMEYKSKSVTRQKSFGLKMTSERMGIINELYQTKTSIKIIDEKDAINNSCGTKVIIEIPV